MGAMTTVATSGPGQAVEERMRAIYFAPAAPVGLENNWSPAVLGRAWFAWFRHYAPLQPYFDRTWRLPDIEKVTN